MLSMTMVEAALLEFIKYVFNMHVTFDLLELKERCLNRLESNI